MNPQNLTTTLNCFDEVCPGSHERHLKMKQLLNKKIEVGSENFMEEFGKIIQGLHQLHKEELMGIGNWSEHQANVWIDRNINFMHVKMHEIDGKKYLSVDPIIQENYHEALQEKIRKELNK